MAPVKRFDLFRPHLRLRSTFDVDLAHLRGMGIRGIIVDLDNTLVPYGGRTAPAAARDWVRRARAAGFALVLVSNNRTRRARTLAAELTVPMAPGWMKPSTSMFRRALTMMDTTPAQTALIGDQLLTDILGGNRLGLYTILVAPLGDREFITTRLINRAAERLFLRALSRRDDRTSRS